MNRRPPAAGPATPLRRAADPGARSESAEPADEAAAAPSDEASETRHSLMPVIRSDVLPSLHAKFGAAGVPALPDDRELSMADLEAFVDALIASDTEAAEAIVERLRREGARPEWIVLNLFSAAARQMGLRWEHDRNDFAEVTIAMSHLGGMMREFAGQLMPLGRPVGAPCRVLLAPVPGEQHTFGLTVVGEFLVGAGFDVCVRMAATADALTRVVQETAYDAVGLSLSSERLLGGLEPLIRNLRCASANRAAAVVVGGSVFGRDPALWRTVGADMQLADVREAPIRILRLVRLRARRYGRP